MKTETFDFSGAGGQRLSGLLEQPGDRVKAWAIFAHCFTCTRDSLGAVFISRALANRGIGVLRFDFTGLGESEGEFGADGIGADIADLKAAAQAMADSGRPVSLLVGHSLGGAAVLHAAGALEEVKAVVALAAPADPAHVLRLLGDGREQALESGCAEVRIGGRPFTIREDFVTSMQNRPWEETIGRLRKALLIMHAPLDDVVGIDNAAAIFDAAMHPKSFVSLDGANHLLTRRQDAGWAADVIAAWAGRYLPETESRAEENEAVDGVRSLTAGDAFLTRIRSGRHQLLADEPESVGGQDQGPSPYELLAAALGSCTGMTLAMYARHKKLKLESVTVDVRHDRVHAQDCEHCEDQEGKIDRFRRQLHLEGEFTDSERNRLLEIADRCPVHRTLENQILIETRLGNKD